MNPIDLTPVLEAVISLCAVVLTTFAIPWLKQEAGMKRTKRLYELAGIAVRAAEQLYGEGAGKQKAEYVLNYLRANGFDVSMDELRGALEAAVYQMNQAIDATA